MHADFLLAAKIVAAWIISENMPVISFTTTVRFSTASTCQSMLEMVSWIMFFVVVVVVLLLFSLFFSLFFVCVCGGGGGGRLNYVSDNVMLYKTLSKFCRYAINIQLPALTSENVIVCNRQTALRTLKIPNGRWRQIETDNRFLTPCQPQWLYRSWCHNKTAV